MKTLRAIFNWVMEKDRYGLVPLMMLAVSAVLLLLLSSLVKEETITILMVLGIGILLFLPSAYMLVGITIRRFRESTEKEYRIRSRKRIPKQQSKDEDRQ